MEELIVPGRVAAKAGRPSLERLVVRPDGLLGRDDYESSIELMPFGGPKLFQGKAAAQADHSIFTAEIVEELAANAGATGQVLYKESNFVYGGLLAIQFYFQASGPTILKTKRGGSAAARPIGSPAVLWIENDAIAAEHLVDAWDGVFAATKQRPDIARAGYVLGELRKHVDEASQGTLPHQRASFLDEMRERTGAAAAVQFYLIGPENFGTRRNTGLPTQRVAAENMN